MRLLLDECVPARLRRALPSHQVSTVVMEGWSGIKNGQFLTLTTRFDLAIGIGGALDQLPAPMLEQVELVSLPTTLTTNSVVEGKGSPVCVLLAGYDAAQIMSSGLVDLLGSDAIVSLPGRHDAGGFAVAPPFRTMPSASRLSRSRPVSACASRRMSCNCTPGSRRCATGRSPVAPKRAIAGTMAA